VRGPTAGAGRIAMPHRMPDRAMRRAFDARNRGSEAHRHPGWRIGRRVQAIRQAAKPVDTSGAASGDASCAR
jgi:hypothetical protein